jgi:hypothetical protein
MPFLRALVSSGAYRLDGAFWGTPASTPFFQACLLYGIRHPNLPAYLWFDRQLGKLVRMNVPEDARSIEARLGGLAPRGLLEDGGTAYLSLFSGHAPNVHCMAGLTDPGQVAQALMRQGPQLKACMRDSRGSSLSRIGSEIWRAGRDAFEWSWRRQDGRHEWAFFLNQIFVISLAWKIAHRRALIDMVNGVPAIYLVFANYDEVAHRRGPTSSQALDHLYQVDGSLAELFAVAKLLPNPYDVVFLSDHGHVDSLPFEERGGLSIERYLLGGPAVAPDPELERALLGGRPRLAQRIGQREEIQVIDAGNFAHVYFRRRREPMEVRELLAYAPDVLARAASHPDVGIVALRRGAEAVAVVNRGVYRASEIESAPLRKAFSRRAVRDLLLELPHMSTAGDLVLYGQALDQGTVGFSWEFGSHGGLTQVETDSVVLWPRDSPLELCGLQHAMELHERLSEVYRN